MTTAEDFLHQFDELPIITVVGACYLALHKSKRWEEYTDSKRNFLYAWVVFNDGSRLKIHRDGWVRAYCRRVELIKKINVYTHKEFKDDKNI